MNYQQALDYVFQYANFEARPAEVYAPEHFNLSRMEKLLDLCGNPHQAYPCVHIAGTKGKGSTAAMTASVLQCAGMQVGLYTSPHLVDFRERVQVSGVWISEADFAATVLNMQPAIEQVRNITYFEIATAISMQYFADQGVDIAVFEVGLGGRLDATNVVKPLVSVITAISKDHTGLLGDTIEEIAGEKGGIIKPEVPVVIALQPFSEALTTLTSIAQTRQSPPTVVDAPLADDITIALQGQHQRENAATVAEVVDVLRMQGVEISPEAFFEGLASVKWPGRFEVFNLTPPIVLDAAHNPDSAQRLVQTLVESNVPQLPVLVYGSMRDKDIASVLDILLPHVSSVVFTKTELSRAMPTAELATYAANFAGSVHQVDTIADAVALAHQISMTSVLVTGSIPLIGAAREYVKTLTD